MPYIASPGRCIYCPGRPDSDEHIIPQSLGGRLVIENASCKDCRRVTSEFERIVAREMYWPLRLTLGIKGSKKHKTERPTHWMGVLEDGDSIQDAPIEVGRFPAIYTVMEFAPPGLLIGLPMHSGNPEMKLRLKASDTEIRALCDDLGVGNLKVEHTLQWAPFARMIAKICHAYAVSVVGLEGMRFYLPELILGTSGHLSHHVGGLSDPTHELKPPHDLGLAIQTFNGAPHIVGRTTLFGANRFPTYEAVVGEILDLDLITRKISCAQQM